MGKVILQLCVVLLLFGAGLPLANAGSQTTGIITNSTGSLASAPTASAQIISSSRITGTQVTLSAYAEEVARILKFDRQILLIVKQETGDRVGRLVGFDEQGYRIIAPGIAVTVPDDMTDLVMASLRKKLVPLRYMPFVMEINGGIKVDKIGVLKGTDQFDILRIMHTNGAEYDISNQDVIDHLKEWEKISWFDIIGADNDWVELEFRVLPEDLKAFAEEVYDFSPDAIDQGPGTVEGLIRDLKRTNRLFLWWD